MLLAIAMAPGALLADELDDIEQELFGDEGNTRKEPGSEELVLPGRALDLPEPGVETLHPETLRRWHGAPLVEVLADRASAVTRMGPFGERLVGLRGFHPTQTALFIDGLPASSLDLSLLPQALVERVTLIQGTAPVLLGPDGVGGAINIITRRAGRGPLASLAGEHGPYNAFHVHGDHALVAGPVEYLIQGGFDHRDSSGLSRDFVPTPFENGALRENSQSQRWNLAAALNVRPTAQHRIGANLLYLDGRHGVPPSTEASQASTEVLDPRRYLSAALTHQGTLMERLVIDDAMSLRIDEAHRVPVEEGAYGTLAPVARSQRHLEVYARLRGRTYIDGAPWGLTFLRLAAYTRHERLETRTDDGTNEAQHARTLVGLGPEAEAALNPCWTLTVGLQIDLEVPGTDEERGLGLGWGPLVTARYMPLESVALRGTVARRTRFPSLIERFPAGPGATPAPVELTPESAWHMGLDATWRLMPGIELVSSLFDAEVLDLVQPVSYPTQTPFSSGSEQTYYNVQSARFLGAALGFVLRPLDQLQLRAGYSFLYARRTDEDSDGEQLPYRPMNKASLDVIIAPLSWLELSTFLDILGSRPYQDPRTRAWGSLDPYVAWDARLLVRPLSWGSIWVRANNILGINTSTEFGYPEMGRRLWLGLQIDYDRPPAG